MATVKVNLKLDNQEFDKNLKQTDKELQRTKRNVNTLSKSMELNPNFDNVFNAFKEVVNAITLNQQKLEDLNSELKKMESSGDINTDRYKKLQEALYKAQLDAENLEISLEKVTKNTTTEELVSELSKSEESIDKLREKTAIYSRDLESLNKQSITIDSDFQKTKEELVKAEEETKKLEKQLAKLGKTKVDTKEYKSLQKELENSNKKTEEINKKLGELSQQKINVTQEIKHADKELKECELSVKEYTNAVKIASRQQIKTKTSQENLQKLSVNAKSTADSMTQLGKDLAPLSGLAMGALYGITKFTKDTVKAADEISTSAERIGMSAENFQKWSYIGQQTDVDIKELETGFRNLNATIADMSTGKINESTKALERLGIDSKQALNGLDGNLDNIINSLMRIESPTERVAIANDLFGKKIGQSLVPMLNQGAEGLEKLKEEFSSLGYITNEQAQKFADFDNKLNKLKTSFKNIRNQIAAAFLPIFTKLADTLQNKVIPAIKKITEKFEKLGDKPKGAIITILGIVAAMAPLLLIAPKISSAFKTISSGIGLLRGGLGKLNISLMKLLANPIVLVVTAIIAVIVLLYIKCEDFRNMVNDLFKSIYNALKPIIAVYKQVFKAIIGAISQVIKVVADALMPILNMVMELLKPVINIIKFLVNILSQILAPILRVIMLPIMIPLKTFITMLQFILPVVQKVINVLKTGLAPVFKFVGEIFNSVGKIIGSVFKYILVAVEWAVNGVIKVINFLLKPINSVIRFFGGTPIVINEVSLSSGDEQNNPDDLFSQADKKDKEKDKEEQNPFGDAGMIAANNATNNTNNYNYTTNNNYNNDSSTINVTVENYGAEADPVELASQIRLQLIRGGN